MRSFLVDIGGTNLRIWTHQEGEPRFLAAAPHRGDVGYLLSVLAEAAGAAAVDRIAVSVAAPVASTSVALTNNGLKLDMREVCAATGAGIGVICNDLAAAGYGVSCCPFDRLQLVAGPSAAREQDVTVVVGLGTGLGIATGVGTGARRLVIPGEGGHATAAGRTKLHHAIIERTAARHGHVSNERLISFGIGLQEIFRSLSPDDASEVPAPAEITRLARRSDSLRCSQALEVLFQLLGVLCGNLALGAGAGAVYLVGDQLAALKDELARSDFAEYLRDKGRFRSHMEQVSVFLVDDPLVVARGLLHVLDAHAHGGVLVGVHVLRHGSRAGERAVRIGQ